MFSMMRVARRTPPSAPDASRLRPTAVPPGLEILAAAPRTHPPLPPRETGRRRGPLVAFPPPRIDVGGAAVETHSAYVRLCRWVGDGYQPVYSSLVCGSEEDVAVEPFVSSERNETETGNDEGRSEQNHRAKTLVARIPTMHVPIGCLRGGGGSAQEPGCMLPMRGPGVKSGSPPPRSRTNETVRETHYPSVSGRGGAFESRLAGGRDALVGAAELTPGNSSPRACASLGGRPAALRCDELDSPTSGLHVSSPLEVTSARFSSSAVGVARTRRGRRGAVGRQSSLSLSGTTETKTKTRRARKNASRAATFASRDDGDGGGDTTAAAAAAPRRKRGRRDVRGPSRFAFQLTLGG